MATVRAWLRSFRNLPVSTQVLVGTGVLAAAVFGAFLLYVLIALALFGI